MSKCKITISVDLECKDSKNLQKCLRHIDSEFEYHGETFPFSRSVKYTFKIDNIEDLDPAIKHLCSREFYNIQVLDTKELGTKDIKMTSQNIYKLYCLKIKGYMLAGYFEENNLIGVLGEDSSYKKQIEYILGDSIEKQIRIIKHEKFKDLILFYIIIEDFEYFDFKIKKSIKFYQDEHDKYTRYLTLNNGTYSKCNRYSMMIDMLSSIKVDSITKLCREKMYGH